MNWLHATVSELNPWLQFAALSPLIVAYWILSSVEIRGWTREARRHLAGIGLGAVCYWYLDAGKENLVRLLALAVVVFVLSRRIEALEGLSRRWAAGLPVVLSLGWLVAFKYSPLWVAAGQTSWMTPLGISYYVFRMISYSLDVYWKEARAGSLLEFLHYVIFFPTLIAGPIDRIGSFRAQAPAGFSSLDVFEGFTRIIVGAAKKTLLADVLCVFVLGLPLANPDLPLVFAPLVFYAYPLRMYWDFSGYTDMAIGAGRLLGYRPPENFDRPFASPNLQVFWTRWHISLSSWIRDYLYYPILGIRVGRRFPRAWNAMTTLISMGLCGLWHGASWSFLWWGLYHGAGLVALSFWQGWRREQGRAASPNWLGVALTFNFVTLGLWLFFDAGWTLPATWLHEVATAALYSGAR